MNVPKANEYDYIDFLIGTQQAYSCTEAARVQPDPEAGPAHDAITRLIQRLLPTTERLWQEVKGISWFEAKTSIIRDAVRAYLAHPAYVF